jgi:glycerol-3-phosphate acyltransferase PlsY
MTVQWPIIIVLASAYLIGSIPFGLIFVRCLTRTDIRSVGSGNIGATNARRAAGNTVALAVLVCDLLKGVLPVLAARWIAGPTNYGLWFMAASAIASMVGHIFPIYLGLKPSGKGVATALGGFLVLAPTTAFAALAVFLVLVIISRRVSVGSLVAVVSLAPFAWLTTHRWATVAAGILTAGLIVWRHKENIQRLLRGQEPTLGQKN